MGRTRNFYFQNRYFISGVRYMTLLENPTLMGKAITTIIQEFGLDSNINWRFNKLSNIEGKGNLELDLSKVNIANNQREDPIIINVDNKIIDITKTMIAEGLDDDEITKTIYVRLMKEGFKMENNVLVKNNDKNLIYDVVLDMGNYSIKAKCGENKITMTSKTYIGIFADIPGLEWIEYEDERMYIGTENGAYTNGYDKVKKSNNLKGLILYAINKAVNSNDAIYDVNLGYLLPISQTTRSKEIVEALQDKEFEFKTQDGSKLINIKTVTIMPEGYSSTGLFLENENMIEFLEKDTLLLDCGSRTINAVSLSDGNIQNAKTLNRGSFKLYELIHEDLKNKTKEKSIEKIADLYEKGKLEIEDNIHIDFLKKMENSLITYSEDLEDYDNIVLTGGVSKLLQDNKLSNGITLLDKLIEILGVNKDRVHVLDNPTESNIDGAMLLLNEMNKVA